MLLKLAEDVPSWTFDSIAHELNISSSSVHRSVQRAIEAGLFDSHRRKVNYPALREFVIHGARYVFPPKWQGEARGLPTAWAAPPLADQILSSGNNPPVWADAQGTVRGIALQPLDPAVPDAVRKDQDLWELLSLFDAIRVGAARERNIAKEELDKRLSQ
ncbi:MAG: hypothetical protein ACTHN3_13495 [Solirubrobacterales bacterium]